jgi:hypothetical protein
MTRDCLDCRHAGKPTRSADCLDCLPPEWAGYVAGDDTGKTWAKRMMRIAAMGIDKEQNNETAHG